MENKKKKLWAHYEQIKSIIGIYITLFFCVPLVAVCFSLLANQADINAGVQDAVKLAILGGLKWYAIIMPIVTVLFAIWFICYSGRVEFTDNAILCYRFIFSKKKREVLYNDITECVVVGRFWNGERRRTRSRKIIVFNKKDIIITFDIYYKLSIALLSNLGEQRFKLVGEKGNLSTVSTYFKIDFTTLTIEEQLKLLKYYCSFTKYKYKTGDELLNKK